jgi:methionyl-tRNA formyltransferase
LDDMENRIVFMGSPEFAQPSLSRLAEAYEVVGVVTQPDRKSGRGRKLTPPPVKTLATSLGIPVIQPSRLRDPEVMEALEAWSPTLIVVAAYGQILRQNVLDLPIHGCINVHASLLPRWRGASPVHHAILHGDRETGVTIMRMDAGLDTGPMLSKVSTIIEPSDTTSILAERLSLLGADLLVQILPAYLQGGLVAEGQNDDLATYAPMLKKKDGNLDFVNSADMLVRQVRAYVPWPGAFFDSTRGLIKVHQARSVPGNYHAGKQLVSDGLPAVATSEGVFVMEKLQPAGKSVMDGEVFLQGAQDWSK